MIAMVRLAFRFAGRERRAGVAGFRLFLACLALGVASIASVGTLSQAVVAGLKRDARSILGGEVVLSLVQRPATPEQLAWLGEHAQRQSASVELRAMAVRQDGVKRTLVQLKAVDPATYPLYGRVVLAPDGTLADALAGDGAVIEDTLAGRLEVRVGDSLRLGETSVVIRAILNSEPDRVAAGFDFGPRLMIARPVLERSGLVQPGSLLTYSYRVTLPPGISPDRFRAMAEASFPKAGWRIRDFTQASPGIDRFVERMSLFLTLVGLTALLIGGVGVGNAVSSYLATRQTAIATLKCLGAPARLIFLTYLLVVLTMAGLGIALGLSVGALAPWVVDRLFAAVLPLPIAAGFYPAPLAIAAAFGVLTTLVFSLWPLGRARAIPAAALFRDHVTNQGGRPDRRMIGAVSLCAVALAALAVATAERPDFAGWFVLATLVSALVFRLAGTAVIQMAKRLGRPENPRLRLALSNLHRPGAPTASIVMSLGLGLTVLVVVALIQGNLGRQIADRLPQQAPTFFFIDIQPDQLARFEAVMAGLPGVSPGIESVPSLRGRISAIKGVPAEHATISPDVAWAVDTDRGLTYASLPPDGSRIVKGAWWPKDYAGPPTISLDAAVAKGLGVTVGDALTINVLGRDIEVQIANLRQIDWSTLGINFAIIFAPGTLEAAPHSFIAIARTNRDSEEAVLRAVGEALPTVTAIRVRDALQVVNAVLASIGAAAKGVGALALVTGILVLAGAMAAGQHRRIQDAVILKVLGATRRDVAVAFMMEFALIGLATSVVAMALGSVAAWLVVTEVMKAEWALLPGTLLLTPSIAVLITVGTGLAGTWRALAQKAAPYLKNA